MSDNSFFGTAEKALHETSALRTQFYELEKKRNETVIALEANAFHPITKNLTLGYTQFTPDNFTPELMFMRVSLRHNPTLIAGHDEYHDEHWSPSQLELRNPFSYRSYILPLSGLSDNAQPALRRLSTLAQAIYDGAHNITGLRQLLDIDQDRQNTRARIKAIAETLINDSLDRKRAAVLRNEHPALTETMRSMDWDYDMADHPSAYSRDMERTIRNELHKLPLDDATALFIDVNRTHWTRLLSYLNAHPDIRHA